MKSLEELPKYQINIKKDINPNMEEITKLKEVHTLTLYIEINDDDFRDDVHVLLSYQSYVFISYRKPRYYWLPFWRRHWISVIGMDEFENQQISTPGLLNKIGQLKNIDQQVVFHFSTEEELRIAEPMIRAAITIFLDKVYSKGPYYLNLREFHS